MADLPRRIEIVPWGFPKATVLGPGYARNQNNARLGGGWGGGSGTSGNNGDYMEWDVLLDAGTWAVDAIYPKNTGQAIAEVLIDGVSVGTVDTYAASGSNNNVTTWTGFTVATPGYYTVRWAANGKNASSSSYGLTLQLLVLRRTGP